MAHSVIPHHHPGEGSATDEQPDKDQHEEEHDNGLSNIFSFFQHIGTGNQFITTHHIASVNQIGIQLFIGYVTSFYFKFYDAGEPVPILYPDHPPIYSSSGKPVLALRGPPTITG